LDSSGSFPFDKLRVRMTAKTCNTKSKSNDNDNNHSNSNDNDNDQYNGRDNERGVGWFAASSCVGNDEVCTRAVEDLVG
jgi:hypothetical protein